ncbi:unnamed protein product [Miscanthus lutarioriparius]|uniref:Uncharacterized protein n=1 Tax=Miscanthus lutarioriparius TaxID=422564 RepID=A0A811Q5C0_9POAL|nr:unnamed protein product [Miscanthus lutarioriparius]
MAAQRGSSRPGSGQGRHGRGRRPRSGERRCCCPSSVQGRSGGGLPLLIGPRAAWRRAAWPWGHRACRTPLRLPATTLDGDASGGLGSGLCCGRPIPIPGAGNQIIQLGHVRNQDYYDNNALNCSANEDVETRIGTNMDNIDGPSVSESDILRQGAIDVPGRQY